MADLEHMLLEAAGRTNASERNRRSSPPKNKRRYSYSDDGSDSKDDDSDDAGRGYSSRKPSGSQVPLKKRLDPADRDDSNEDGEDSFRDRDSDADSFGSDLYKDEDDRKELAKMTELNREMILAERSNMKSDREMHEKFAKKRKSSPPQSVSRGMRSSTRFSDRTAAKDDALNEIRAKRKRQQDPEAHQKLKDAGSGGRGYSPVKRRSFSSAIIGSPTRSLSGSDEEGSSDGGLGDSDDEKESKVPTYEDIREITIRRSKLAKWLMEPFFDDLIVGCFVRVGIGKSRTGPIYRLCSVRNVDASDPDRLYKLDNKTTYKWLNCVWGNESSAARWQMAMISDSPPTRDEYDQWVRELERNSGRMPSKQEVMEKKEAIQKTNSFVYSAETVKQMLQDKKSATWRPLNVAAEKDRLRKAIDIAIEKNDDHEVERLKSKLKELEATRVSQEMDAKAKRLAEMNKKNRVENFKNASGSGAINADAKAGEAGYDPFSRRWTRSRNYYLKDSNGTEAAAAAAATAGDGTAAAADGVSAEAGTDAKTASIPGADLIKVEDAVLPVGQGTELVKEPEFKIEISLDDSHKYRVHAGYMARKQRIEATIGCKVPENDGRRHALTLTVSDYKRRMGLL